MPRVTDPFFICQAQLQETGKDHRSHTLRLIFTIHENRK